MGTYAGDLKKSGFGSDPSKNRFRIRALKKKSDPYQPKIIQYNTVLSLWEHFRAGIPIFADISIPKKMSSFLTIISKSIIQLDNQIVTINQSISQLS